MLKHRALVDLLQMAYSAEKAAAFAYQGHAASLRDSKDKEDVRKIELDEWHHRQCVLELMNKYQVPVSKYYEIKFHVIGKIISLSCHVIGWFMPYFFAGRLESGNVCEYFRMKSYFNEIGISQHDVILYEMGIKEKEHEVYFYEKIKNSSWLPFFEKIFSWGKNHSFNDIDLNKKETVQNSKVYCKR